MISFIIIGKNIEKTISLCLDSVYKFVKVNRITEYEIIYVDSSSKDKSVTIAKNYPIMILQINGKANSAIGRNTGAKFAIGNTLFFIDGDMEILPDIYKTAFNEKNGELSYPFVTGARQDILYNNEYEYIRTIQRNTIRSVEYKDFTGGFIIIAKDLWSKAKGYDERLIRNQDLDFSYRISLAGTPVKFFPELAYNHHTKEYHSKTRFWEFYSSKSLFCPGILMRKHLFRKGYWKRYHRTITYVLMLLLSIAMIPVKPIVGLGILALYIFITALRGLRVYQNSGEFFMPVLYKLLYNFWVLIGFLFYYPSNHPKHSISELTNSRLTDG